MSDFDNEARLVARWISPLEDESVPCGPDLEYDNEYLALVQAATGKPESQFGPAEPPDWRSVVELAEALLDRSRDLRIAVLWLRAKLHVSGYTVLPLGLTLLNGMIEQLWANVHPMPDPDDGDPYARVNTLASLREPEGLLGDLRESRLIQDRAIGELTVRSAAVTLGLMTAAESETAASRAQLTQMLGDALAKTPALREQCLSAVALTRQLMTLAQAQLGDEAAPDLRPLYNLINGVAGLLPSSDAPDADSSAAESIGGSGEPGARRSLAGSVNSREDAIRAIDMICVYLERAEPTNPAPLFLKRARQLIGQNFLQLLKALAPQALSGVADMVGVDPDSVEHPEPP